MAKNVFIRFVIIITFFPWCLSGQNWSLKLKSKVELRNWQLTSKAIKHETFLNGASIQLYKGSAVVSQTTSDAEGNFEMNIPANGNYTLVINYTSCNPKKFAVNTIGVSSKAANLNFKPSVDITGFIMSKPIKGINYLGLNQPLVTIEYDPNSNGFAKTDGETKNGVELESKIYDAEYKVIQKFCTANKLGDMALDKKDYSLAKTYYLMASDIMDDEPYPKTQLKKALAGMKLEKVNKKKVAVVGKKGQVKKAKSKPAPSNQKIIAKPANTPNFKNNREAGSGKKIAKPL